MRHAKQFEIAAGAVLGGVVGVYVSAAADAGGLATFTVALSAALVLAGVVVLGRKFLDRRRRIRRREQERDQLLVTLASEVESLRTRLDSDATRIREQLDSLRGMHRDHAQTASDFDRQLLDLLKNMLTDTGQQIERVRRLVVPGWLLRAEQWARKNGWEVTYTGDRVRFAREGQADTLADVMFPLGSHQEEEATRGALHRHIGYPEPRRYLAQFGRITRVLGRGDPPPSP